MFPCSKIIPLYSLKHLSVKQCQQHIIEKTLPEHLESALNCLMKDCNLSCWTVQLNTNMTLITIHFMMDTGESEKDHVDNVFEYKRLAPSQLHRDMTRAEEWREKCDKEIQINYSPGHLHKKSLGSTKTNHDTFTVSSATSDHSAHAPSITTRSKTGPNSSAKPFQPQSRCQSYIHCLSHAAFQVDGGYDSPNHTPYTIQHRHVLIMTLRLIIWMDGRKQCLI